MQTKKLESGNYYHIFNHAAGGRDLFRVPGNYEYFLMLYDKYISPVADTFAWCLMPNHFHLLVRMKENIAYKYCDVDFLNADGSVDAVRFNEVKWKTTDLSACEAHDSVKIPRFEKHFSHLFNAYAKYINTYNKTHGVLFERPFKRKLINNENYLKQVVLYIHNNPVHHNFCEHPLEYPWTSYLNYISIKPTKLHHDAVIGWFDSKANFKVMHNQKVEITDIEKWLEM